MVLINMDMPQNCMACKLCYDSINCIVTGSEFNEGNTDPYECRLPDCPL